MEKTIDDVVNNAKKGDEKSVPAKLNANNGISFEARIESAGRAIKSVGKAAFTGALIAGTYGLVGKSSLLTAAGNGIGYLIEKIKGKEKINGNELNKEVATGSIMGVVGHKLYSMIDFIPNYNLPLKVLKTVAFNPIMLAPYIAFYRAFTYLRDKVGTVKSLLGFLNLKIFKYLKDAYTQDIKPNFKDSMKQIMYLSPIHFASINYVKDIWKRVGIGVFNDIAFRIFQSKKPAEKYDVPKMQKYSSPAYG